MVKADLSNMALRNILLVVCALFAIGMASRAHGAAYYEGKTIRLIVGNNPVGGYAVYARLLAQYLGRHIPGNPKIQMQYMPGAGGVVLGNYMAAVAPRDGLTIGMIPRSALFEPLLGNGAAKFRSQDFTWLGTTSSYANDAYCLIVRSDTPYRTLADLQKAGRPAPFGGEAAGGTDTDLVMIAKDVFRLNIQVIRGYQGPGEIGMAMEKDEVVGRAFGMSSLEIFSSDGLRQGEFRFLVQFSRARWSKLPDVPTARELTKSTDDRALIELAEAPLLLARPYLAPPQIPAAAAAILKKAFMDTHADPDYLAENAKMKADISPLSGDEVQEIVKQISHTPPALIERYRAAMEAK